jgi:hypothetical protein
MLKDPEVRRPIDEQLAARVQRLEVHGDFVVIGILQTIEDAKNAGQGAWQAATIATILRGYERLGRYLDPFTDRLEVNAHQQIMERLIAGRRRAAGLPEEEEAEDPEEIGADVKPN